MTSSHKIIIQAPGKLFVAGEYAVVEAGYPAVLIAVNRYVTVELVENTSSGSIHSEQYGKLPVIWHRRGGKVFVEHEERPFDYVLATIDTLEQLVIERGLPLRFFDLSIVSELDDSSGRKFGLGSSAAVTVATTLALNEFYGLGLDRLSLLKLSLLATVKVNSRASGGDLASSMFGGWVLYSSPDRSWLQEQLKSVPMDTLIKRDWPGFSIEHLPTPKNIEVLVGWTGEPASTTRLVDTLKQNPHLDLAAYHDFLERSRITTLALADSVKADDAQAAMACIRTSRELLQQLAEVAGITIETTELGVLCETAERAGAAAKSSGAGGGDCGIVLADAQTDIPTLVRDWELNDIRRLSLSLHPSEKSTP